MKTGRHLNRTPFEGVLTFVDVPSDQAPSGARGHCVMLTRAAAEAALPGLVGMAVNYKSAWDGHDPQRKIGVIDAAEIVDDELRVSGYLFGRDFPEVLKVLRREGESAAAYGMSYELADAHVLDKRMKVWELHRVTFCGAAILLQERAAYRRSSFWLRGDETRMAIAAVRDEEGCEDSKEEREQATLADRAWKQVVTGLAFKGHTAS